MSAQGVLVRGRVALVQLLGSLYGVKQHYLKPGLFQDDLDEFWMLRHRTVAVLFDHLAEVDQLLADQIATPASDLAGGIMMTANERNCRRASLGVSCE